MGGGNGAKAAQKRERNAKAAKKGPTSQLKQNEKALTIQCMTCRQTFLQTTKSPALTTHAEDKHKKVRQAMSIRQGALCGIDANHLSHGRCSRVPPVPRQ